MVELATVTRSAHRRAWRRFWGCPWGRALRLSGIWCALIAGCSAELATAASTPEETAESESAGPERLKEQTRVIVETNLPPVEAGTTNVPEKTWKWSASWKGWDGLHLELENRTFLGQFVSGVTNIHAVHLAETRMAGKIGARLAVDGAAYLTDRDFQDFNGGVEVRRARIYAKGDCLVLVPVSYELEIGYVPGSFYIEDSYLDFRELGFLDFLGSIKFGQFRVPMSLVNYGSSRDMMLMEAASPVAALAPGVDAGLQVGRPVFNKRMTWALGLFTDGVGVGSDFGEATQGFGRVVGRLTGLPIYHHDVDHPESQRLLHLGLSGSALYADQNTVRYRSRPESHLAPYVVDTGDIDAEGDFTLGMEAAWVNGPLCLQGELLHSWVRENGGQNMNFGGFYGQASWFLTGESRPYNRVKGTFARVVPKRNFNFGKGGWGAWEVTGRYSDVNLNDGDIRGGRLSMIMTGVTWYLHSHLKWCFNYGFGHVSGRSPDGNLNIFQTRVEVDF
jgi:phosphate-selective porin OprO/OprP